MSAEIYRLPVRLAAALEDFLAHLETLDSRSTPPGGDERDPDNAA